MQIRDVQSTSYPTAGLVVRFDVTDRAARLLSTIQNGGAQCWIVALFGEEFQ